MKRNKDLIRIIDWTGTVLFEGPYNDPEVDVVLDANRCSCDFDEICTECTGTGFCGDFIVEWVDQNDERNVYEYINY